MHMYADLLSWVVHRYVEAGCIFYYCTVSTNCLYTLNYVITVESISPHLQNGEECDADSTCIYILISECVSKVEVSKPPGFLVFMWLQSDALTIRYLLFARCTCTYLWTQSSVSELL